MARYADRVAALWTGTGTGTVITIGATPNGTWQSFANALVDGDTTDIAIYGAAGFECCSAVWNESAGQLTRGVIYTSSNAGARVNFGAGQKIVTITIPASKVLGTDYVSPESFGALGDDPGDGTGTDDATAFGNMVTYMVANNIKVIKLGANKIYNVFKSLGAGAYVLMTFSSFHGIRIETNGARFVNNINFGSVNATVNVLNLTGCKDVDYGTLDLDQVNYHTPNASRGFNAVTLQDGCRNIQGAIRQNGGFNGMVINRGGSYDSTKRAYGIRLIGDFQNVYYPTSAQRNGDDVRILARTRGCGRAYTVYNARGHDVFFDIDGTSLVESFVIKCFAVNGDTVDDNTTSDIKFRGIVRGRASGNHGTDMALEFQQLTASAASAAFRNIDIELDVTLGAATWTGGTVTFTKIDSVGAADTTLRNYVVENVRIGGAFRGYAAAGTIINLFNTGTWTGEGLRSVILRGITIAGTTADAINVNCASISQFLTLDNITSALGILYSNYSTSILRASGVKSTTINYPSSVSSTVASGSAVSLTSPTAANVTTINLPAGEWDVYGDIYFTFGGSTNITILQGSVSTTSATLNQVSGEWGIMIFGGGSVLGSGGNEQLGFGPRRINCTTTTTVYLVAQATFTVSTAVAFGRIRAVAVG